MTVKTEAKPAKRKCVVFVTCPECEAGFPVQDRGAPLPPHRAFRGMGQCPGVGKPGGP